MITKKLFGQLSALENPRFFHSKISISMALTFGIGRGYIHAEECDL
jgi:hypothetical protein